MYHIATSIDRLHACIVDIERKRRTYLLSQVLSCSGVGELVGRRVGLRVGDTVGAGVALHLIPVKHSPAGQRHTDTSRLFSGEHPQAPIPQVFGNSPASIQQLSVETVPPEATHC